MKQYVKKEFRLPYQEAKQVLIDYIVSKNKESIDFNKTEVSFSNSKGDCAVVIAEEKGDKYIPKRA
jgi:hypothetical protein